MNKYLLVHDTTEGQDYIRTYLIESGNGVTIMYSDDLKFKAIHDGLEDNSIHYNYNKVWSKNSNALYIHRERNWVLFKCIAKTATEVITNYLKVLDEVMESNKLLEVIR